MTTHPRINLDYPDLKDAGGTRHFIANATGKPKQDSHLLILWNIMRTEIRETPYSQPIDTRRVLTDTMSEPL